MRTIIIIILIILLPAINSATGVAPDPSQYDSAAKLLIFGLGYGALLDIAYFIKYKGDNNV